MMRPGISDSLEGSTPVFLLRQVRLAVFRRVQQSLAMPSPIGSPLPFASAQP